MKLVYFSYINNSFPVLYVLNEITRGLVLVCRMLNFHGQCSTYPNCSLTEAKPTMQVTQDHSLGTNLFVFSFFLENLCSIARRPVVHPLVITIVLALLNKQSKSLPVYATFCFKFQSKTTVLELKRSLTVKRSF